ncbi:MAG: hypothetical protein ACKO24_15390 [Leptolyngbyaceae cyanobacterium]
MQTIYLVRSLSNNISFDSNQHIGLHFIESSVDIGFLNNTIFDGRLKILIDQKSSDQWIGKANIWFILLDRKPLTNQSLEEAYVYIKNIGIQLFKVTRMGQSFSYKNIYTITNVNDSWSIEDTYIKYSDAGGFEEIYCLDKTLSIERERNETIYQTEGKTVKSDLVIIIGSDKQQKQAQFIHITMPAHKIDIDASNLRVTGDLSSLNHFHGVDEYRSTKGLIYELYNDAITSQSIFTSYLLLFQIVEVVISEGVSSKLSDETISTIMDEVSKTNLLDDIFVERLRGLLKGLKKENSMELLQSGIVRLLGEHILGSLDFSAFPKWRKFRGKITHPMRTQELTDTEFTMQYKSLRKFVDNLACTLS